MSNLETQQFPPDYSPDTIEVFDSLGLLFSLVNGELICETQREQNYSPEYLAWYFDGELAYFLTKRKVIFNRITLMANQYLLLDRLENLSSEIRENIW
jgi:hypothetical protein